MKNALVAGLLFAIAGAAQAGEDGPARRQLDGAGRQAGIETAPAAPVALAAAVKDETGLAELMTAPSLSAALGALRASLGGAGFIYPTARSWNQERPIYHLLGNAADLARVDPSQKAVVLSQFSIPDYAPIRERIQSLRAAGVRVVLLDVPGPVYPYNAISGRSREQAVDFAAMLLRGIDGKQNGSWWRSEDGSWMTIQAAAGFLKEAAGSGGKRDYVVLEKCAPKLEENPEAAAALKSLFDAGVPVILLDYDQEPETFAEEDAPSPHREPSEPSTSKPNVGLHEPSSYVSLPGGRRLSTGDKVIVRNILTGETKEVVVQSKFKDRVTLKDPDTGETKTVIDRGARRRREAEERKEKREKEKKDRKRRERDSKKKR